MNSRRFMELCPYDFVRRRISSAELSGKHWQCAKAKATCSVTRRAKLAWAPHARRGSRAPAKQLPLRPAPGELQPTRSRCRRAKRRRAFRKARDRTQPQGPSLQCSPRKKLRDPPEGTASGFVRVKRPARDGGRLRGGGYSRSS